MTRDELWRKFAERNPSFDGDGSVTLSARGLPSSSRRHGILPTRRELRERARMTRAAREPFLPARWEMTANSRS